MMGPEERMEWKECTTRRSPYHEEQNKKAKEMHFRKTKKIRMERDAHCGRRMFNVCDSISEHKLNQQTS